MTNEEKNLIIKAAQAYIQEKQLSQNEFGRLSGVNASYLSSMSARSLRYGVSLVLIYNLRYDDNQQ